MVHNRRLRHAPGSDSRQDKAACAGRLVRPGQSRRRRALPAPGCRLGTRLSSRGGGRAAGVCDPFVACEVVRSWRCEGALQQAQAMRQGHMSSCGGAGEENSPPAQGWCHPGRAPEDVLRPLACFALQAVLVVCYRRVIVARLCPSGCLAVWFCMCYTPSVLVRLSGFACCTPVSPCLPALSMASECRTSVSVIRLSGVAFAFHTPVSPCLPWAVPSAFPDNFL